MSVKYFETVWEGEMSMNPNKTILSMNLVIVEAVLSTFLYLKFFIIKLKR